ncbi:hypothetical protein FK220_011535 [Flavobacteriaceae bacterium TP-CH-4]|uniref:Uncharacterized protein n=1 Tax=Pelagihabitans pacificus TaxID=2696054 RepID=A0A967AU45_9FLAO|nr:hypothetical protein [Pelagihabitans pacificus]NHF59977.1 hypothetical protein [Pelagihabitans pacificus]
MPTSTIPFDPSLVLGMVVKPDKITQLEAIANLQKPVDAARNKVNALLRQKLSLDMTLRELTSLGAGAGDAMDSFKKNLDQIMDAILKASVELSEAVMQSETAIADLMSNQDEKQISSEVQSPLDFAASQLKPMPISSDTMNMDVQYYRYETNDESDTSTADAVSAFVATKVTELLGPDWGASAGGSAHSAIDNSRKGRNLLGTVVICANCTHKQAQMFSPLILDVEDTIENYVLYTGKKWDADPEDPDEMLKKASVPIDPDDEKSGMPVLIGATYGSSFVGFVHFEQIEGTQSRQSSQSAAAQASGYIEAGLLGSSLEGSFGVDTETAKSVKSLLSTSDVQSHCSLITMGLIPSIKSNEITTVVDHLQGGPAEHMKELAAMQDASNSGMSSMASIAGKAKTGQSIEKMKTDYIKGSVEAVAEVDTTNNSVIDMNSLMTAFDDFVKKAANAQGGVPINFYLKYITERTIAVQWMKKYQPDMLHPPKKKGDDSGTP